ncbi:MAG TPA: rhodanese-like domain-containing protein [Pyrinomonadaceae bacterium]
MRSKFVLLATACSLLLVFACQKAATPSGFVKYKDESAVPRVSVQDAKAELDGGTAIMVDARPEASYREEHAAGSINIPLDTPPDKFKDEVASAEGKKIFIYCS